jgi:hypothetical protein
MRRYRRNAPSAEGAYVLWFGCDGLFGPFPVVYNVEWFPTKRRAASAIRTALFHKGSFPFAVRFCPYDDGIRKAARESLAKLGRAVWASLPRHVDGKRAAFTAAEKVAQAFFHEHLQVLAAEELCKQNGW